MRSVSNIVIAPARTGSDSKSKKTVIKMDQTKRGILCSVIPGARILKIVVMKLIDDRIDDAPAKCRDKIAISTAGPEWNAVESGA